MRINIPYKKTTFNDAVNKENNNKEKVWKLKQKTIVYM